MSRVHDRRAGMTTCLLVLGMLVSSACTPTTALRQNAAPLSAEPPTGNDASVADDRNAQLMWAARNGDTARVKRLLEEDVDPNVRDADGETALFAAASSMRGDTVQALLDAGAEVNAANSRNGWTPLMIAAFFGAVDGVRLLLQAGADVNATNQYGETALLQATFQGQDEVVKLLLAAGADVAPRNDKGFTALRAAKYKKFTGIVQALEDSGARQ